MRLCWFRSPVTWTLSSHEVISSHSSTSTVHTLPRWGLTSSTSSLGCSSSGCGCTCCTCWTCCTSWAKVEPQGFVEPDDPFERLRSGPRALLGLRVEVLGLHLPGRLCMAAVVICSYCSTKGRTRRLDSCLLCSQDLNLLVKAWMIQLLSRFETCFLVILVLPAVKNQT